MAVNVNFGHRTARIPLTPSTLMIRVVELAKEQLQIDSATNCHLQYRKTAIDLSIPFRLTGIPNMATLSLMKENVSMEIATQSEVRVSVQLSDMQRHMTTARPDMTIQKMLEQIHPLPVTHNISFMCMQREIFPHEFASTTLRDLGILNGSVMFRARQQQQAPAIQAAKKKKKKKSKKRGMEHGPNQVTAQQFVSQETKAPQAHKAEEANGKDENKEEAMEPKARENDYTTEDLEVRNQRSETSAAFVIASIRKQCSDVEYREAVTTLTKIVSNILSDPGNAAKRSIRIQNPAFHEKVGRHTGGIAFLQSIGFAYDLDGKTIQLKDSRLDLSVLSSYLKHLQAATREIPPAHTPNTVSSADKKSFDVFSAQITRIQAQPRGGSRTELLVESLKAKKKLLLPSEKPERETIVMLNSSALICNENADSDTAENSAGDRQMIIENLRAMRDKSEGSKTLKTRAMRDLEELQSKKVFKSALIRVRFPDRVILQASFHPNETISDVRSHVIECLNPSINLNPSEMYLYLPLATQKLEDTSTLTELGLIPAAILHVSWGEGNSHHEDLQVGAYLQPLLRKMIDDLQMTERNARSQAYPESVAIDDTHARNEKKRNASTKKCSKKGSKPSWMQL